MKASFDKAFSLPPPRGLSWGLGNALGLLPSAVTAKCPAGDTAGLAVMILGPSVHHAVLHDKSHVTKGLNLRGRIAGHGN